LKRSLQLDPLKAPASWDQIKSKRDQLEQSPLRINGQVFDADEIAEKRLTLSLNAFETLPTVVSGKLTWKLADNSLLELTKVQLADVLDQLRLLSAQRAATLHYQAGVIAQAGATVGQLDDLTFWGVHGYS
jgi:hypothetical protein